MSNLAHISIDQAILDKTQCRHGFACLSDRSHCAVEVFMDRDLRLVRCLAEAPCQYKTFYANSFLCRCPVNREFFTQA